MNWEVHTDACGRVTGQCDCGAQDAADDALWDGWDNRDDDCLCNIGVQACPWHPDHLKTKEEKIQFRKEWDARVERGWREAQ